MNNAPVKTALAADNKKKSCFLNMLLS